jgi:arginyl-tRNA synthetase
LRAQSKHQYAHLYCHPPAHRLEYLQALKRLDAEGHLYVKEGATWFASSKLGDEKDRVVVRDNGQGTYFASDIAYHMNKLDRGFDQIINIWGADHHGYIPRVRAAMQALGADTEKLKVLLVQIALNSHHLKQYHAPGIFHQAALTHYKLVHAHTVHKKQDFR